MDINSIITETIESYIQSEIALQETESLKARIKDAIIKECLMLEDKEKEKKNGDGEKKHKFFKKALKAKGGQRKDLDVEDEKTYNKLLKDLGITK